MNEIKKYGSSEGHRSSIYFKESSFPALRKLITLCDYYRQRDNKQKQGLSYWIALMLDRFVDEIYEEVIQKENIQLNWKESSLIVIGKKTPEDKLIDKAMKGYGNE